MADAHFRPWPGPVFQVKFQSALTEEEVHSNGWGALEFYFWFVLFKHSSPPITSFLNFFFCLTVSFKASIIFSISLSCFKQFADKNLFYRHMLWQNFIVCTDFVLLLVFSFSYNYFIQNSFMFIILHKITFPVPLKGRRWDRIAALRLTTLGHLLLLLFLLFIF